MLQRQCACGGNSGPTGECEECRKKRLRLHRRAAGTTSEAAPPLVDRVLQTPGHPLDPAARAFLEPRFGCDFGAVRVHADDDAARSAQSVNALAYTVGSHVVFGTGRYAPRTREGLGLLAHELTHVVQQGGAPGALQRQSDDVAAEADAERERFRAGRRRDLSAAIDAMRFRKVVRDCAPDTGVRLLDVLAGVRSRVAGNPRCLEFFRRHFNVDPTRLLSPDADPTYIVDPTLTGASGQTRCPRPATRLRPDLCPSPLRDRVIVHELVHYAGCRTPAGAPSTEELAEQGETVCIGTVREELDRARGRRSPGGAADTTLHRLAADGASPGGSVGAGLRIAPARSPDEAEADAVSRAVLRDVSGALPLSHGGRRPGAVLARQSDSLDEILAAGRERALRYEPRFRPHVPRAPTLGEPPPPQEPAGPCQRPSDADVVAALRDADVRNRTEAAMSRAINLARSLSSGRTFRATPSLLRRADRAIRAEFGSLLPSGRNFTDRGATTVRSAADFATLRVPNATVARRRIGSVALAVDPDLLEQLCVRSPTDAALDREVAAPLLANRGLDFVRDHEAAQTGGQTTMSVAQGQFTTHVDLPQESRNMGHIVVHEALHFYVSQGYHDAADAHPQHDHALMEGGAEFLARHVIHQRLAGQPEFQINYSTYADEFRYVADHLLRGGVSSFTLAYFQGRVDLLGFSGGTP